MKFVKDMGTADQIGDITTVRHRNNELALQSGHREDVHELASETRLLTALTRVDPKKLGQTHVQFAIIRKIIEEEEDIILLRI